MSADAGTGPTQDPERPGVRRGRAYFVGALAVLVVAALVGVTLLAVEVAQANSTERLRAEALHTARQLTVNFTTVDYQSFDRDSGAVLNLASGDFRTQYVNASGELEKVLRANKAVSKGKVLSAGLVSFDPDSARALVVADAEVTNAATKKPQQRSYRLQLDLVRQSSGWRVVDVQFVG